MNGDFRRDLANAAGQARARARLFESMGARWAGKGKKISDVSSQPSATEGAKQPSAPPPPAVGRRTEHAEAPGAGTPAAPLAALEREAKACEKCVLSKTRSTVVFGSGDPSASIVFVGEAPGADEDRQGLPFVGRAGKLLTDIIEKGLRIPRARVYICNVLKCRPPENRSPKLEEIVACTPHLFRQIETIRPKVICALGTFAAQTLLETTRPISSLRGQDVSWRGIPVVCTFHPAYLLRNPPEKKRCWQDIQRLLPYL